MDINAMPPTITNRDARTAPSLRLPAHSVRLDAGAGGRLRRPVPSPCSVARIRRAATARNVSSETTPSRGGATVQELVRLSIDDHLAWITLDRPDVMNALSFDTLGRLGELVAELAGRRAIRVVLVTGAGERAFCAGADLKERRDYSEQQVRAFVARIGDTFSALAALPQPTIAVLNGVAYGGGLELALACDLRVAASTASMGLTETSLAIIPGAGGTQRLPRVVGAAHAKELIFTARKLTADEALSLGLVNAVAEPAGLVARATELARSIAANGPLAVAAAKAALDLADRGMPLADRLDGERALYLERVLPSADRLEALAAFREKRKPEYRGR
jgi:enoyl-CoA hydratase/carnithine racemase